MIRSYHRPMHPRTLALLIALALCAPEVFGATYQVGPGRAYTTLQAASSRLRAGDVVEVDGDATYSGMITFRNSARADAPITIRGVTRNGRRPVLAGVGGFPGGSVVRFWGHHYIFENFEVTAAGDTNAGRGLHVVADDVTIRDCSVHDVAGIGIHGSDSAGSLTLDRVEVFRCGAGTLAHQIYVATDNEYMPHAVFRMQGCYVHDATGGNSVKSRAGRSEIYSNWIEGSAYYELDLIGADPTAQYPGSENWVREDADVVGNVLIKRAGSTGTVARLGSDGLGASRGRYRFVNNTFVIAPEITDSPAVIRFNTGVQSLEMHHNVFFRGGLPVRVVSGTITAGMGSAGVQNWLPPASTGIPAAWTNAITNSTPGFRDVAAGDYTPLATGSLFDAGVLPATSPAGFEFPSPLAAPLWHPPTPGAPAQPRPAAGALDIGAFETTAEAVPNTPPVAGDDLVVASSAGQWEAAVLDNDSDADGDALTIISITPARQGVAAVAGSRITFRPSADFNGEEAIEYRVSDGRATAQARVTFRNPFAALRGTYDALAVSPAVAGYLVVKISPTGLFTGSLKIGRRSYSFSGAFDFAGHAVVTLTLRDGSQAILALDFAAGPSLVGSLSISGETAGFTAPRAEFTTARPTPHAGGYTVLLRPQEPGAFPPGTGFATMRIGATGSARFAGRLGEGSTWSSATFVRADGSIPVFGAAVPGGLTGTLSASARPGLSDFDGTLTWRLEPQPAGAAIPLDAVAARLAPPSWSNARVTLSGGGLVAPIVRDVVLQPPGALTVSAPGADALTLKLKPATGWFGGTFLHPSTGRLTRVEGVTYAPLNIGGGVFGAGATAGAVELSPQ